jgi:nucleotide-binding universal stress UspA family protein
MRAHEGDVLITVREVAQEVADHAAAHAHGLAPELDIAAAISPDLPAAALVAASREASLVVVGSRGLGGFTGLLLGSTGLRLLHHARSPVAVVRD